MDLSKINQLIEDVAREHSVPWGRPQRPGGNYEYSLSFFSLKGRPYLKFHTTSNEKGIEEVIFSLLRKRVDGAAIVRIEVTEDRWNARIEKDAPPYFLSIKKTQPLAPLADFDTTGLDLREFIMELIKAWVEAHASE